jgi:hypothetical protein
VDWMLKKIGKPPGFKDKKKKIVKHLSGTRLVDLFYQQEKKGKKAPS